MRIDGDARTLAGVRGLIGVAAGSTPEVAATAVLLTNELVTNAVVHGGGTFSVELELCPDRIRVSVLDADPHVPEVRSSSANEEHGRGMAIVAALATAWGADGGDGGKVVWFELSLPGGAPP